MKATAALFLSEARTASTMTSPAASKYDKKSRGRSNWSFLLQQMKRTRWKEEEAPRARQTLQGEKGKEAFNNSTTCTHTVASTSIRPTAIAPRGDTTTTTTTLFSSSSRFAFATTSNNKRDLITFSAAVLLVLIIQAPMVAEGVRNVNSKLKQIRMVEIEMLR